jgi:hypothetical protein
MVALHIRIRVSVLRVKLSAELSGVDKKRTGVEVTVLGISVRENKGNSRMVRKLTAPSHGETPFAVRTRVRLARATAGLQR